MKLYDINNDLINILNKLELQDEVSAEDIQALDISEANRQEKVEGYISIIKSLDSEIAKYDEYKKQAEKLIKQAKTKQEWLKSSLLASVEMFGEVKAGIFKVAIRKSKSLSIEPGAVIPNDYLVAKTTESVDKTALTRAIKDGKKFEGIELKENNNLAIK